MRTKKALVAGIGSVKSALDKSIEIEKEENDFLIGVRAIVEGAWKGQIECRIYTKDKFHAKAYITQPSKKLLGQRHSWA